MPRPTYLLAIGLLTATLSHAQSFRFRADAGPVQMSGYHQIRLPPDVVGRLNADLTDIRLYDDKAREVPYRLTRRQPAQLARPVDFELVNRTIIPKKSTVLVMRQRNRALLRSITVQVKNADVRKVAQLSGSADAKTWYALREAIAFRPTTATLRTTTGWQIDLPTSDYPNYRLTISDSLSEPLNILRVSYDSTTIVPGTYTIIDDMPFVQRDSSDQKTYIRLTRPYPTRFDKLKLDFSTESQFVREAAVGAFRVQKRRRGRPERYFEIIQNFRVTSADSNVVYLPGLNAREFYVVIDNGDSPPLRVRGVQGFQISSFLTANLTAGTPYQLRFSDPNAAAPQYDLAEFRQPVALRLDPVRVTNIRPADSPGGDTRRFILPQWFIWVALSLVVGLLTFLSMRMLREMGKPNT